VELLSTLIDVVTRRRRALSSPDRPAIVAIDGRSNNGKTTLAAEEIPFNAAQRTWERADIIICGTPEMPHDPSIEIVIAPPLLSR
jgi:hypothetical protein